jgi:hypothetical protein
MTDMVPRLAATTFDAGVPVVAFTFLTGARCLRSLRAPALISSVPVLLLGALACSDAEQTAGPSPTIPESSAFSPPTYLEPAGMRLLTSNDWAGFSLTTPTVGGAFSGWHRYQGGNSGRAIVDPAAGCGSTSVLEVSFKQGTRQGTGPEHLAVGTSSTWFTKQGNFSQIYLRYCVWVPTDYYGSSSGVQKIFHIWGTTDASATGGSQAVPALYGVGTKALSHQLRLQNMSTKNGGKISFNISCKGAARGRWDRVELLLTQNTGGQANGSAKMWVNGSLCLQRNDLTWSGAGRTAKRWTGVQLNPTYGGSGTVTKTQYMRYGAVRISAQ